ncbi:MAG: undecaprenyldiphospho-muramoylpentapeptide beta-N-acetylglucosaminyltransferase [Hyphomicrobiales bacterium]
MRLQALNSHGPVRRKTIVLAAGGTGGHLFCAEALGKILGERGFDVYLMTDRRGGEYARCFPSVHVFVIPSATITLRRPLRIPGQLWRLVRGYFEAHRVLKALHPVGVMGFGGYPSIPPLLAAWREGMPIFIHEQNAVMGRANRFMAPYARLVATGFPEVLKLAPWHKERCIFTSNPVREAVHEAAKTPYHAAEKSGRFNLLVFGGSQGTKVFCDVIPKALARLPDVIRRELKVVQQCRREDVETVRGDYVDAGIEAEAAPFYHDLPRHMAQAHLVVARAGASTVTELGVIGRPAILVPLPDALDRDQLMNAQVFVGGGGGWLVEQEHFTDDKFADLIMWLYRNRQELEVAAHCARRFSVPDATIRLAEAIRREIAVLETQDGLRG